MRAGGAAGISRSNEGCPLTLYSIQSTVRQWIAGQIFRIRRRPDEPERIAAAIANPRAVLFVIAGMLGDTVMSIPTIHAARKIWPRARFTLLGQRHNCELLRHCPDLDDQIETPTLPFSIRHRGELRLLQQRLGEGRFDVALLILGDQFARMLADAGVPVRVGVRDHVLAPCLTHEYDIGSPRTWGPNERLNAIRVLGFDVPPATPRLSPSEAALGAGADALMRLGLASHSRYAVIHPFGSTRRQWWPIDRVASVCDHLGRVYGLRTVLVGGAETRGAVSSELAAHTVDATGRLTITELVGLLAGAAMVVSTDSGPYHIAGALGRPLIGLFRSRRPEHAGRYPQARVVFGEHAACAQECTWDRCASAACRQMNAISDDSLIATVDAAVERQPSAAQPR